MKALGHLFALHNAVSDVLRLRKEIKEEWCMTLILPALQRAESDLKAIMGNVTVFLALAAAPGADAGGKERP